MSPGLDSPMPRSLILAPTRELAAQVAQNFEKYGVNHKLEVALLIGGVQMGDQVKALNEGVGHKVSVNDLLVWCVARALMREPRVNVNLVGDDIHQFRSANIAVAIATCSGVAVKYPCPILTEMVSPGNHLLLRVRSFHSLEG